MLIALLQVLVPFSFASSCNVNNCLQCSSTSSYLCLDCADLYSPSRFGCSFTGIPKNNKVSNCLQSSDSSECLECKDGYQVLNGFCEPICPEGCFCFEPFNCEGLNAGHISEKSRKTIDYCQNCKTCKDNSCKECEDYYKLHNEYCVFCSTKKCSECSSHNYCIRCESGYRVSAGSCLGCPAHCTSCISQQTCSGCEDGYSLSKGYCSKQKDDVDDFGTGSVVGIVVACVGVLIILVLVVLCIKKKWYLKFRSNRHLSPAYGNQGNITQIQSVQNKLDNNHSSGYPVGTQPYSASPPSIGYQNYQPYPPTNNQGTGVMINPSTFNNQVKPVTLDERESFFGQQICLFCSQRFRRGMETRVLPCGHAFHGKCIYDNVAIGYNKFCPQCKTRYF